MTEQKRLGEFLLEAGIVSTKQIEVALSVQKSQKIFLGEILQNLNFVTAEEIAHVIAQQQDLPFVDIEQIPIQAEALRIISKELALEKKILPIEINDDFFTIAAIDTTDITRTDYLEKLSNRKIDYLICDREKLSNMIELHYYQLDNPIQERIEKMITLSSENIDIIEFLDLLVHYAIKNRATDIHITPDAYVVHVFYRIDGVLQHNFAFDLTLHSKIVSRIKILSNLDISEQRLPQDGGFSLNFLDQDYDLRISTLPTSQGENVVLRILTSRGSLFGLESLGLGAENLNTLKDTFAKPHGMILVTGPTGSGKTTTLYSALREMDALSKNIITVEDPIEYRFSFVKQTEINSKTGYDFSKAIRHFMRQDPDVMLIGEIRDEETAKLALRASITGHLVLSTLHANSAVATIPRLYDMDIEADLLATTLHAVIAQRLIRRVCKSCSKKVNVPSKLLDLSGNETYDIYEANDSGCERCNYTGYLGRSAIVEVLNIDESLKILISDKASVLSIKEQARKNGFVPMRVHAVSKVLDGTTTLAEINRVTS